MLWLRLRTELDQWRIRNVSGCPAHSHEARNMAASTDSNSNISASIAGILNEKHCAEHVQALKTFTAALRDKEYRCGQSNLMFF